MKKKGFTLVELLAVIVILAIIAIITTPIILNVIETARKNAAKSSALGYIDAIEKQIMMDQVNETSIIKTVNGSQTNGVIYLPISKLSVKGEQPTGGWIQISNRQIINYSIVMGNYVTTNGNVSEGTTATTPPQIVVELEHCTPVGHTPIAYNYGDKYNCEVAAGITKTFYVLEDGDSATSTGATLEKQVTLIMDQNLEGKITWATTNSIDNGADAARPKLPTNWTNVKVDLPTGLQIANAGGDSVWTENNKTETVLSSWLYGNLGSSVGMYGYWTSTSSPNKSNDDALAWLVYYQGFLEQAGVYMSDSSFGVRPVITVSKK